MTNIKDEVINYFLTYKKDIVKKPSKIVLVYYDVIERFLNEGLSFHEVIDFMKSQNLIDRDMKENSIYTSFKRYKTKIKTEGSKLQNNVVLNEDADAEQKEGNNIFFLGNQKIDFTDFEKLSNEELKSQVSHLTILRLSDAVKIKKAFSKYLEKVMPLQTNERNDISMNLYQILSDLRITEASMIKEINNRDKIND